MLIQGSFPQDILPTATKFSEKSHNFSKDFSEAITFWCEKNFGLMQRSFQNPFKFQIFEISQCFRNAQKIKKLTSLSAINFFAQKLGIAAYALELPTTCSIQ